VKIGIFIDRINVSGGQVRVVANLCHAWVQSGWEVHLITTDQHACSYSIPSSVVRHKLLSHPRRQGVMRIWDNFLITLGLRKVAYHERLNGILAISAVESVLLALARCPSSVIKLGSEHVYARHYPMPTMLGLCRKFVYPMLDGVVCPASQAARALREDCPRVNAINIPNLLVWPSLGGADSSAPRLSRERRRFVSCGRLVFDKGFEDVIEAFSRVAASISEWDLVIIGDGPAEEALKGEAKSRGLIDRVMFVGHTDQAHKCYEESDVFVYASPKEGFGMVIAEAQASGLPVICYDCLAGPRDIVCDGESGILIPLGDVEALADAMRQLAFNDELRLTMSKKASRVFERLGVQALMPTWGNAFKATKPGSGKLLTQY
jgi:glycosyltransferase involved in cell wall biosynthesis